MKHIDSDEIPIYPQFTPINIGHKARITEFINKFHPYCDYTFSNLYIWEVEGFQSQISLLNNNLIVQSKNILTHNEEVSLIGDQKLQETVEKVLHDHKIIHLVPSEVVEKLNTKNLIIEEDHDNHDYIFSTEALSLLKGKSFLSKRKKINRFLRKNRDHKIFRIQTSDKIELSKLLFEVYARWMDSKNISINHNANTELIAIKRFIEICHNDNIEIWGLAIKNETVAFTTIEYMNKSYAISSFAKSNLQYKDANAYLTHETSKHLFEKGIKYINHEQDLGLLNLRTEKLSWKPTHYLKKYQITKND